MGLISCVVPSITKRRSRGTKSLEIGEESRNEQRTQGQLVRQEEIQGGTEAR